MTHKFSLKKKNLFNYNYDKMQTVPTLKLKRVLHDGKTIIMEYKASELKTALFGCFSKYPEAINTFTELQHRLLILNLDDKLKKGKISKAIHSLLIADLEFSRVCPKHSAIEDNIKIFLLKDTYFSAAFKELLPRYLLLYQIEAELAEGKWKF